MNKRTDSKKIIQKIKDITGLHQKEFSKDIFEIEPTNLSNKIGRNKVICRELVEWAINKNVDLSWLLADIVVSEKGPGSAKNEERIDEGLQGWMNYLRNNNPDKMMEVDEYHKEQGYNAWVKKQQEDILPLKAPPQKKTI